MADEEKTLNILLKYGLDNSSLDNTKKGVDGVTKSLQSQEQQLRHNRMELRELSQVFTMIGIAGAAVYAPAIAASQEYVKTYGKTEEASRRWLAAQDSIKTSTIDIGRVVTQGLLPQWEKAAQIAENFAAWAEKNPKAVQAAVNIAGGLVAIAAAGKIFTEVDRAIVDVQLIAATLMNKAADKQLAAAGAGGAGGAISSTTMSAAKDVGGLILKGLMLALTADVIGKIIKDQMDKKPSGIMNFLLTSPLESMTQGTKFGNGLQDFIGSISSFIETAMGWKGGSVGSGAGKSTFDDTAGFAEFEAHMKRIQDIQKQYDDAIEQDARQSNDQIAQIQENFNENEIKRMRDFKQNEQQALDDFNASTLQRGKQFLQQQADEQATYDQQRADNIRNFAESELAAQQTFQNQMADLEKSHGDRMRDLTASRDFLGLIREQRSYEEQKSKAERDFGQQDAQRRQQFAQQLADNERNFLERQAQAKRDFAQQAQDAAENFEKQKAQRLAAYNQQTADLKQAEIDQENQIITNHNNRLILLGKQYEEQNTLEDQNFTNHMNTLRGIMSYGETLILADYNAWKIAMGISNGAPPVNPQTPPTPPSSFSGSRSFSQSGVAGMIGGRSGGSSGYYNNSQSVNVSGMTAQDKVVLRGVVRAEIQKWSSVEFAQ